MSIWKYLNPSQSDLYMHDLYFCKLVVKSINLVPFVYILTKRHKFEWMVHVCKLRIKAIWFGMNMSYRIKLYVVVKHFTNIHFYTRIMENYILVTEQFILRDIIIEKLTLFLSGPKVSAGWNALLALLEPTKDFIQTTHPCEVGVRQGPVLRSVPGY